MEDREGAKRNRSIAMITDRQKYLDDVDAKLRGLAPQEALSLLQKKIAQNPNRWELYARRSAIALPGAELYVPDPSCQIPGLQNIYAQLFGAYTKGRFLEIGAYDGHSHSNTAFLADIGWAGVYVEPVPEYADKCRARHNENNINVVEAAIGAETGQIELNVGGAFTTADDTNLKVANATNSAVFKKKIKAPLYAFTDFVEKFEIGFPFDLLIIDCEGLEWEIVEQIDFKQHAHSVAIIESRDNSKSFPEDVREKYKKLVQKYIEAGYKIWWRDNVNIVFAIDGLWRPHVGGDD